MMDYENHKDYYKVSYKNGADIWTHLPTKILSANKLVEKLPQGASILDIGSGRGLIAKHLAEMSFHVVGIDFESDIVEKASLEVDNWGLGDKLRFVGGDVFAMPFTDASFDGVCDFGLLENLYREDWSVYATEVNRVLRPGGFYLNVTLSRKIKNFLDFSPINSPDGDFDNSSIHYHFFEKEELQEIFQDRMTLVSDSVEFIEKPTEIAFLRTLFQKKL